MAAGMLPEPRKLTELLPRVEGISCMLSLPPCASEALTAVQRKIAAEDELCDYPMLTEGMYIDSFISTL